MREKEYVFIINPETGERKATYLVGIHGTRDKIMERTFFNDEKERRSFFMRSMTS